MREGRTGANFLPGMRAGGVASASCANCPGGGEWSKGLYAWVLEGSYNVEPEPVKGRLHLFDVPDEKIIEMPEGDYWFHYNYKGRDKPLPKRWA